MIGNRFSALPVSQFCAKSAALNLGAGRAAAISSCFHAKCAGDEKWRDMFARLSDEEQEELLDMEYPADLILETGAVISYAAALKEVPLALGEHCSALPKGHQDAITEGTMDGAIIHNRIAYVFDIKRSAWTSTEGPRSLQIKGYALAFCALHADEVDGYVTGVWVACDGVWQWDDQIIYLDSEQCLKDWQRVRAAALNIDGDFATGPHCRNCYARLRCPAYLVPPDQAHGALAKYLTGQMTSDDALQLKRTLEAVKDTVEACSDALKAHVDAHGPIIDKEAGKMFAKGPVKGKLALDKKALEADHPQLIQQYTRRLPDHHQYSWRNAPKESHG